ncbi:MAG: carbon monoxide dehydrogenase subunit G [Nitriliruptor sp.]
MKITGSHTLEVPRERLWAALQDPAVLARTLPGCEQLEALGDDTYAATLTAGVASIKGTYSGQVQLHDKQEPSSYRLTADGSGGPGTIHADAQVRLEESGSSTTTVHFDADAVVGGMIGGVGQRMIAGAARRTAGEFFDAVAADILHGPRTAAAGPAAVALGGGEVVGLGADPSDVAGRAGAPGGGGGVGQVFPGKATSTSSAGDSGNAGRRTDLLLAFVLGAVAALAGVLVGRRSTSSQP